MFNITDLEEKEITVIRTPLPLNEEQLDEYFNNMDNYFFGIEVDDTTLAAEQTINYIYNSNMDCDLNLHQYDQKLEDLLLAYIKTNKLVDIPVLNTIWVEIVRCYIDTTYSNNIGDKDFVDFIRKIIIDHKDIVEELTDVLYNLKFFLFGIKIFQEDKDKNLETVEYKLIGNNFISLRKAIYFYNIFVEFDKIKRNLKNYSNFTNFSYEGYNIHHYFYDEFSPFSLMDIVDIGDIGNEENN